MAKIAVPLASGFEDSEFTVPHAWLSEAGHDIVVCGTKAGERVQGKRGEASQVVEAAVASLDPDSFDALLIPGGRSPDRLRRERVVVDFTRRFFDSGKLVAAICHGPQLLAEAGVLSGRRLTSWPSVRSELSEAGANWVDEEVVVDGCLITSRKPDDLQAFCSTLVDELERRTNA